MGIAMTHSCAGSIEEFDDMTPLPEEEPQVTTQDKKARLFQQIVEEKKYGFFTMNVLINACGLAEELSKTEDMAYYNARMSGQLTDLPQHPSYTGNGSSGRSPGVLPEHRYYGYTIFAEDDAWWEQQLGLQEGSIVNKKPEDVVALVMDYITGNNPKGVDLHLPDASTNTSYTDENNALHQFVTYHILPAKIAPDKLVIHFNEYGYNPQIKNPKASVYDYYTTMGKRRLLKTYEAANPVGGNSGTVYLNRFPVQDNAPKGNYQELACDQDKAGIEIHTNDTMGIYNALFYRISDCLFFNEAVAKNMGSERIRIDMANIFQEFITNDIRCNETLNYKHQCVGMPKNTAYKYLDNCEIGENTHFYYLTGRIGSNDGWINYQGDEFNIIGNYELTIKLPPVPKDGEYELRIGTSANYHRGMCQVYWGTNKNNLPAKGFPIDLRMGGEYTTTNSGQEIPNNIGWQADTDDDDANAEVDKNMRNNGYMKGPKYIYWLGYYSNARERSNSLRRILLKENMKADETYYIKLKDVLNNPNTIFYLDFIEFCPVNVYDNPIVPEDIW